MPEIREAIAHFPTPTQHIDRVHIQTQTLVIMQRLVQKIEESYALPWDSQTNQAMGEIRDQLCDVLGNINALIAKGGDADEL